MKRLTLSSASEDLAKTTVAEVRSKAAELTKLSEDRINLLYCGKLLNQNDQTLESVGIKQASNIHVLKKPDPSNIPPMEPKTLTNEEMSTFYMVNYMALLLRILRRITMYTFNFF